MGIIIQYGLCRVPQACAYLSRKAPRPEACWLPGATQPSLPPAALTAHSLDLKSLCPAAPADLMSCWGPLCPLTSYLALHAWPAPLVPDLWLGVFPLGLSTNFNSCRLLPFGCDFFRLCRVTTVLIPIWPPALTSLHPPFCWGAQKPGTTIPSALGFRIAPHPPLYASSTGSCT